MYFPYELWLIIKDNLFHNIQKHGKHLKIKPDIKKFNMVVKSIPIKIVPRTGPRIVYSSVVGEPGRRYIKYCYWVQVHLKHIQIPRDSYLDEHENIRFFHPRSYQVIEYQMFPLDYDERDEADEEMRDAYWIDAKLAEHTSMH